MSQTSAPPLKFRCHACSQLLGAPPSRAGSATRCPKCRVELIIPVPEAPPPTESPWVPPPAVETEPPEVRFELAELRPEDVRIIAGSDVDFLQMMAEPAVVGPQPPPIAAPAWSRRPEPIRPAPRSPTSRHERRRDLVLPRSIVLAFFLFALVALATTFLAGYLVGRFGIPAVEIRRSTTAPG